jgi:hypothetical protein
MKLIDPDRKITVKTMYGELELCRPYYYCRNCGHGECPDDISYGLLGNQHKITKAVTMEATFMAQNQVSFEKAERMLERVYGIRINRETIRGIAETMGRKAFTEDSRKASELIDDMSSLGSGTLKDGVLYIMIDGAAVNTRVEDANGSTWRENKMAIAFSDKAVIRRKDGGGIITHKEISPLIGTSDEFRKHALRAAVAAGYGCFRITVVIADGAPWIHNMCEEIFPDAVLILDLFHLKENIYGYAKYIYPRDNAKMVEWAETVIAKIENEYDIDGALALVPTYDDLPDSVVNLKKYIENNRERINYPEYKKQGYYVGSGAVESANKTIVQQRLKRAGMRWGVSGAQALLTLRAKDESERWEDVECCA